MKPRAFGFARAAALIVALAAALAACGRAQGATPSVFEQQTFPAIVDCLAKGREVVMIQPAGGDGAAATGRIQCVDRQVGARLVENANMPLGVPDWSRVCEDPNDSRRLPGDIVKRLARETQVAPSGIRILGALFCDTLDLVGVDLPYSLVLDRSAFVRSVDGRNSRIKGDLSVEYAAILRNLRLDRARVEGSVYAGAAFMRALRVDDTRIEGSWRQQNSVILLDGRFVRAKIAGDLLLTGSAFSRLSIQSSQIDGAVGLDGAEARCAFHVNSSSIGYLTADKAGFGAIRRAGQGASVVDYTWWARALSETPLAGSDQPPYTRAILTSDGIKRIADAELARVQASAEAEAKDRPIRLFEQTWRQPKIPGCKQEPVKAAKGAAAPSQGVGARSAPREDADGDESGSFEGIEGAPGSEFLEFYVFDSTFRVALCLTSLQWPDPSGAPRDSAFPITIVALNGSRVAGNLIIDLWGDSQTALAKLSPADKEAYEAAEEKHKFEAIGLSAAAAIYNFADHEKPYFTYLDGLKFDRVHKAIPACASETGAKLASHVELPSVTDVLSWLRKNDAPSSQPFNAFVQAFENAGASATTLRVERKSEDVCRRMIQGLRRIHPQFEDAAFFCTSGFRFPDPPASPSEGPVRAFVSGVADAIGTGFELTLWAVADHGMRPGKVIGPILFVVAIYLIVFWALLRIVAFDPKGEAPPSAAARKPQPIGPLFMFERMIPLYKIREDHHAIGRFYRVARRAEIAAADAGEPPAPLPTLRYFWRTWRLTPLEDARRPTVERLLTVLRAIGAVLTVFLLAAISALTR